jgi:hypothetical protein
MLRLGILLQPSCGYGRHGLPDFYIDAMEVLAKSPSSLRQTPAGNLRLRRVHPPNCAGSPLSAADHTNGFPEGGSYDLNFYPLGDYYQLLRKTSYRGGRPLPPSEALGAAGLLRIPKRDRGTLHRQGTHFKPEYLQDAVSKGAFRLSVETPFPRCRRLHPVKDVRLPWRFSPTCTTTTPAGAGDHRVTAQRASPPPRIT